MHFPRDPTPELRDPAAGVSLLVGMVDQHRVRVGLRGSESAPWVFSAPQNVSAVIGRRVQRWQFGTPSLCTCLLHLCTKIGLQSLLL